MDEGNDRGAAGPSKKKGKAKEGGDAKTKKKRKLDNAFMFLISH